jgi:hypothetical protein
MKTSRDFVDELDSPGWAELEFEQAPLVDRRLNQRLSTIVSDLARRPGASIPQACATKAKTKGAYRFLENDAVDPQQILAGHRQAGLHRLAQEPVVLAASDTTSFNFSHLPQTTGLGPTGPRKGAAPFQGLWLHSTLAFTPEGLPLSLISAQFWSRSPEPASAQRIPERLPLEEKESRRWRQSWEACQAVRAQLPAATVLVNMTDREGDIYEVFAAALAQPQPRAEWLIRCCQNRKVVGQDQFLWELLAQAPRTGTLEVRVPRSEEHPARLATLEIRFQEVRLQAPHRRPGQPALHVWAVEAREGHPPPGIEPMRWRLLSTLPVTTPAQAMEKVRWYAVRWGIEVFHKIVKSVCRAEASQLQTAERLERALMLDLVVAWRLAVLTQVGRHHPDLPASDYFAESEWKALHSYIHRQDAVPAQAPALGLFSQWIGRLGGFIPSQSHPHPGPITLARGLTRLSDLAAMWAVQNTIHPPCK